MITANILAITQARSSSRRLPSKVNLLIDNKPLLHYHLMRAQQATSISQLCVATTTNTIDDGIVEIAKANNCLVFRGSETDVLSRYYGAATAFKADVVVRITSDCPLIDPAVIDTVIQHFNTTPCDYCCNVLPSTFPDGIDVEVFTYAALQTAHQQAVLPSDREHVTPYIWKNSSLKNETRFKARNVLNASDYSDIRLTVDTPEDFELIELLIRKLGSNKPWNVYADYVKENNITINAIYKRNEGYTKSLNDDNKF